MIESGINHGMPDVEITVRLKLPGAIVSAATVKEVTKITTDEQGAFRFQPQEFGEYILQARKDGYSAMSGNPMRSGLSTQINVTLDHDHPSRQVSFLLGREGELNGRVVDDETGEPLTTFAVSVQQFVYLNGRSTWLPFGGRGVTDRDGRFVVKGLKPGRYVVMIMPRVPSGKDQFMTQFSEKDLKTLDADYSLSYWPGGGDLDSAQPVSIVSGGSADAGTIRLRKSPFYRVHVSIANATVILGKASRSC